MALTTMQSVNDALASAQRFAFRKFCSSAGFGGNVKSFWTVGDSPGIGVAPSSGIAGNVPTSATVGAMPFVNPASGNTYLARIEALITQGASQNMTMMLYDRLWHNSGISSTLLTAQTVNSVAITRPDSLGVSAEAWWEVYVVMGAGTPTVTLSYTNSAGTAGQSASSGVLQTTLEVGRTFPFQLASGDTGVRSIQSWTASATFTSGTIGLVLRRLVTMVSMPLGLFVAYDALAIDLPRVYDNACLEVLWQSPQAGNMDGGVYFSLIQG